MIGRHYNVWLSNLAVSLNTWHYTYLLKQPVKSPAYTCRTGSIPWVLGEGLGHADRHAVLLDYCRALMLPLHRKSVELLATSVDPYQVSARNQSLHHFVAQSAWGLQAFLAKRNEVGLLFVCSLFCEGRLNRKPMESLRIV